MVGAEGLGGGWVGIHGLFFFFLEGPDGCWLLVVGCFFGVEVLSLQNETRYIF